jgi:2'-5' RNA ligase
MARARRPPRAPLPRFALAWFPRFEGIEKIEAIRRRHDPAAPLIPAHLSLVFPFPTSLTRLQVSTHIRNVVSRWPPVPVTFRRVRVHAGEFVFLMASRGAASVTALHDKLYTRSLRQFLRPEFGYEPHITVARDPDPRKVEAACAEAQAAFPAEFAGVVREVELLSVARDGKIDRLEAFALYSA